MPLKGSMISRRQFIKGASVAGLLPFVPSFGSNNTKISTDEGEHIQKLIATLNQKKRLKAIHITDQEVFNLTYALRRIKPANHQELVFAVTSGLHYIPQNHIVDEYVRRRNGEKSQLPDHPIFKEAIVYRAPDTQRILIYAEQIEELLLALTGKYSLITFDMRCRISSRKLKRLSMEEFLSLIDGYWHKELSNKEMKYIYNAILYYGKICSSYVYRSIKTQELFEI